MAGLRIALLLGVILFTFEVPAVFSAFVHVTPETEDGYPIEVCVDQSGHEEVIVAVSFEYGGKGGWLITTHQHLDHHSQEFRRILWDDGATDSPIESIGSLRYDKESETYWATVPRDLLLRSYLYFDFDRPVFDGGYYYSVDLSTYSAVDEDC